VLPSSEIAAWPDIVPPRLTKKPVPRSQRTTGALVSTPPTTTLPSGVMSVGMKLSGETINVGAPAYLPKVMSAVTGAVGGTSRVVHEQRLSIAASGPSVAPLKYSSGPGSTIALGTANAPPASVSAYRT